MQTIIFLKVPPTWQVAYLTNSVVIFIYGVLENEVYYKDICVIKLLKRGVKNMSNKTINSKNESFEKNEFVEELIKENIQLSDTVAVLIFENKRLREKIESMENFCKVFGVNYLNSVIKGRILGRGSKDKGRLIN